MEQCTKECNHVLYDSSSLSPYCCVTSENIFYYKCNMQQWESFFVCVCDPVMFMTQLITIT